MLKVDRSEQKLWTNRLKPSGQGSHDKEHFSEWWLRNSSSLLNLHPLICEQWIYRHWHYSPWAFLPLRKLSWKLSELGTDEIIDNVYRVFATTLHPEYDFRVFNPENSNQLPTARPFSDTGTWDYPILTLETPNGVDDGFNQIPDAKLCLIEGHQRHRYLNALKHRGIRTGPHKMFILTLNE